MSRVRDVPTPRDKRFTPEDDSWADGHIPLSGHVLTGSIPAVQEVCSALQTHYHETCPESLLPLKDKAYPECKKAKTPEQTTPLIILW